MAVLQKAPERGLPCTLAVKAGHRKHPHYVFPTRDCHAMQHWLTPPLVGLHGSHRYPMPHDEAQ